jgi:hypothetical protein
MYELNFRPLPFRARNPELEWEDAPARGWCKDLPSEVTDCKSIDGEPAKQCLPSAKKRCPKIPESWVSPTIASVPFYYSGHPVLKSVPGTHGTRKELVTLGKGANKSYAVTLTPASWRATEAWINNMAAYGMAIAAVITAGAGRYCRCIRFPKGVCKESDPDNWDKCTGTRISDHGFGDALDIIGVKWVDKTLVGSSLASTTIYSWEDSAEQAPILIRMNAAMREVYHTVIDYSDPGHRNHFHCDMNQGNPRDVWSMGAERNFIVESLFRLGYLPDRMRGVGDGRKWRRVTAALTEFANANGLVAPGSTDDKSKWRTIIKSVFRCVARGECHR